MRVVEPPTRPSQRQLSEVTKKLVMPTGIDGTMWGPVQRTARQKLGVKFDRWQHGCGQLMLSTRPNGRLATTVGGFGLSAPRQIGKTYFVTPTMFALSINRPRMKTIWTAQHSRTHAETFLYMQGFCRQPRVQPFIDAVFTGSGDEEVRFVNGSRILFGARERGFGRGIPNVDAEVFDEAQILSGKALENMLAAMNRSPFGLHIYLGTPPKPGDMCEEFSNMRDEALAHLEAGATGPLDLAWVEFGAEEGATVDPEDPEFWVQVAQANPSYPEHTSEESILRLRKKLGLDGFLREGLGVWPGDLNTIFDLVAWVGLEDTNPAPPKRVALVVAVAEHRKSAAIAVAGETAGGVMPLVYCQPGMSWVTEKVAELKAERNLIEVALAPGEARGLAGELTKASIEFKPLTGTDIAASCTAFQDAVDASTKLVAAGLPPTLRHNGQTELDGAVAHAKTRRLGPAETWEEGTHPALVAAAAAFHRWKLQDAPMPGVY